MPIYTEGEKVHFHFRTLVHGVQLLINERGFDR